ncbi:MAG: DUF309 domain-containing protein [Verrucomicrobia bacterium]|nr:DUF309 domain-containing protein [Verrucomicrobiota bacterium]
MKKGDRIQELIATLSLPGELGHDPHYAGYFRCFNDQRYYEAHDVLEHLWLQTNGPEHRFYKGMIQFAGAFVHLKKQYLRPEHPTDGRRLHPARRLLKLAHFNLQPFGPLFMGLNVNLVLGVCSITIARIEEGNFMQNPWRPETAPILSLDARSPTLDR